MPSFCAVLGCSNRGTRDNVRFFRIPSYFQGCNSTSISYEAINPLAAERRKKWIQALHREDLTETKLMYARVCSHHFISGKPADLIDKENPDWVPSLNMGVQSGISRKGRLTSSVKKGSSSKSPETEDQPHLNKEELEIARSSFKSALAHLCSGSGDDESDISDDALWPKNFHTPVSDKRIIVDKQKDQDGKYIMKIFDRAIDLAQFNESTPLYPLCRAWIANLPYQIYNLKKANQTDEEGGRNSKLPKAERGFGSEKDVYKLPRPVPLEKSLRIPRKIPFKSVFNSFMKEGEEPPSKEDLLQDNLQHWLKINKSWREASLCNEARYEKSIRILTDMFDKAQSKSNED